MRTTTYEAVTVPAAPAYAEALRFARNVALFVAAPFIGLVYAVAFPLVGLAALAWMGARAVAGRA